MTLLLVVRVTSTLIAAEEASAGSATRAVAGASDAEAVASAERRISEVVSFLAADSQEGRGLGSEGLERAADLLARGFAELGLKTDLYNGKPFQSFDVTIGTRLGEPSELALVGPATAEFPAGQRIELAQGTSFMPLALGGSGTLDLPLAFLGYGITGKDEQYDDYAPFDAAGKAVIVLRHEPQQGNPHSPFDGTRNSSHAPLVRKISNAFEHGAAAIVFCSDHFDLEEKSQRRAKRYREAIDALTSAAADFDPGDTAADPPSLEDIREAYAKLEPLAARVKDEGEKLAAEFDPLLEFDAGGSASQGREFPVVHVLRAPLDQMLAAAAGQNLAAIERTIDESGQPQSRLLDGWRLQGQIHVEREMARVKNVVAVLEGEGPHAEETLVIGAHYDHLGRGGEGSLAPDSNEIHNGADDNASGAAALLEVARLLARRPSPLGRRVVFIAFTAEERGLLGSAEYVRHPLYPLESTVAMLNMDMVGRLDGRSLIVHGTGTAKEFDELVERTNAKRQFKLSKQAGGFGPSDHSSFYAHEIPVLHFFTGTHKDYHRPSDDVENLNVPGIREIVDWVAEVAVEIADAPARPTYVATKRPQFAGGDASRPYFGSVPDFSQDKEGYALMSVSADGPAQKAGLQGGDVIIKLGDSRIGNLEDFDSALRKFKAGDKVPVVVRRGEEEVTLEVTLEAPR